MAIDRYLFSLPGQNCRRFRFDVLAQALTPCQYRQPTRARQAATLAGDCMDSPW